MVNFRYHIVSLVAVFLALGVGVLMGTTVVNDVTLDTLRREIKAADDSVDKVQAENRELSGQLDQQRGLFDQFVEETGPALVEGRLTGVPVMVMAVEEADGDSIDELRTTLASAGADFQGTLSLTDRLKLEDEEAVDELADILGVAAPTPERVRATLTRSLASALLPSQRSTSTLVADLLSAGFLDYQPPGPDAPEPDALPPPGTRLAVVGGVGVEIPDDVLLRPIVDAMALNGPVPVVVATPAPRADDDEEQQAAATALVEGIRDDDRMAERLSTVDNLDQFTGQAATVLALQDLGSLEVGHFGVADGAQSLLPPSLS